VIEDRQTDRPRYIETSSYRRDHLHCKKHILPNNTGTKKIKYTSISRAKCTTETLHISNIRLTTLRGYFEVDREQEIMG